MLGFLCFWRLENMATPERATGVLLIVEEADQPYLNRISGALSSCKVKVYPKAPDTLLPLILSAKKAGLSHIITTRLDVLKKLLPENMHKKAKISNYAGSIIPYQYKDIDSTTKTMEFLILDPLKQLMTVSYGEFIARRYISKLTEPAKWRQPTVFEWALVQDPLERKRAQDYLLGCDLISFDCETSLTPIPHMFMMGYTGWNFKTHTSKSFVVPIKNMEDVLFMRAINACEVPKVAQNGKYDCAWAALYNSPVTAYLYDTANAFHSWYCELPKDLGMVSTFFMRNYMYHKDLSSSGDYLDSCRYNALDTWATGEVFLSWLAEAPDWAKRNYIMEFSVVPGAHMCEMTGIKRNMETLRVESARLEKQLASTLDSLRTMVGTPNFNPSSPQQVLKVLHILGDKTAESSDEKNLTSTSYKHPLNERILGRVLEYRGDRKLLSTYLTTGDNAKEFGPPGKERILFSLNPHGTDTGRLASKEHHFWCGLQIQNIPADSMVKATLEADPGFELWEADLSQAEDRGVAFSSGDPTLLEVFSSGKDSHSLKAAMFFGMKYEDIYDVEKKKVKRKELRNLGKRINHGANYNMGAYVLVQTMGPKAVREAQKLLGLPKHWDLKGVATHLLNIYSGTFPVVKGEYYDKVVAQVMNTRKLVGATGWTRYCFGNPVKNKMDLNAYVAHVTQSLNAMNLNKAFIAVFNRLAFNPDFKLVAQIHDSIFFQTRIGRRDLAEEVVNLMTFPVRITDCRGITRDMVVPADLSGPGKNWKELKA